LLASFKVVYRAAKCEESHFIRESFILSAAIDIVKTNPDESYPKELQKIPLSDKTVRRRRILDT